MENAKSVFDAHFEMNMNTNWWREMRIWTRRQHWNHSRAKKKNITKILKWKRIWLVWLEEMSKTYNMGANINIKMTHTLQYSRFVFLVQCLNNMHVMPTETTFSFASAAAASIASESMLSSSSPLSTTVRMFFTVSHPFTIYCYELSNKKKYRTSMKTHRR